MRGRLQHISYVSEKKGVQTLNEPTTYSLRVVSKKIKYYSHIIIVIGFEERLQLFTRGKRAWYSKRTELLINHALQRLSSSKVNDAQGTRQRSCERVCFFFKKLNDTLHKQ